MKWTEGNTPNVPEGEMRRFIVAYQSEAIGTFELVYLNRYLMPAAEDGEPPENAEFDEESEEYIWTGWHVDHCDHCEVTWVFSHPEMIIAHMPTPKYDAKN